MTDRGNLLKSSLVAASTLVVSSVNFAGASTSTLAMLSIQKKIRKNGTRK
jgi:hypothetical protein